MLLGCSLTWSAINTIPTSISEQINDLAHQCKDIGTQIIPNTLYTHTGATLSKLKNSTSPSERSYSFCSLTILTKSNLQIKQTAHGEKGSAKLIFGPPRMRIQFDKNRFFNAQGVTSARIYFR